MLQTKFCRVQRETFSNLTNCLNITTQSSNLQNLLNRVKSLTVDNARFDQDTRERMCNWVWRKFQLAIDIHKDFLEKKEHEIALLRAEVSDLLDRILPPNGSNISSANNSRDPSSTSRQFDAAFDILAKTERRHLENNASCSAEAGRRYYH